MSPPTSTHLEIVDRVTARLYRQLPCCERCDEQYTKYRGVGYHCWAVAHPLRLSRLWPTRMQSMVSERTPEEALTETENQIIDEILTLLNKNGLSSLQSLNIFERLDGIMELEQRLVRPTTH